MDIYHKKLPWLGFVFLLPVVWISISLAGYTDQAIPSSDLTAVCIIFGVCFLVSLQFFMGSTRFYFDNDEQAGFQIRKHFYGDNIVKIPYVNINEITVRCYRHGIKGPLNYQVGLTEVTNLFGCNSIKFTNLRFYNGEQKDLSLAIKYALDICAYTQIKFIDDSKNIRAEMGRNR